MIQINLFSGFNVSCCKFCCSFSTTSRQFVTPRTSRSCSSCLRVTSLASKNARKASWTKVSSGLLAFWSPFSWFTCLTCQAWPTLWRTWPMLINIPYGAALQLFLSLTETLEATLAICHLMDLLCWLGCCHISWLNSRLANTNL